MNSVLLPAGASGSQGKGLGSLQRSYKNFKARLLEVLNNLSDNEDNTSLAVTVSNNAAHIEDIKEEEEVEVLLKSANSSSKDSKSEKSGSSKSIFLHTLVFARGCKV